MARVKIKFPNQTPNFTIQIPIRITDINYGNHLGNDKLLGILHEARVAWLLSLGLSELDIGGCGLIMADSMLAYKNESFYGDVLTINMYVTEISARSFDLLYQVLLKEKEGIKRIADAKTAMVCYQYETKQITEIPEKFLNRIN